MRSLAERLWRGRGVRIDPYLHEALRPAFEANPVVVYDVGAAGVPYSFGQLGDTRERVVAFEPTPVSHAALVRRFSGVDTLSIHQVALASSTGEATFRVFGQTPTNSSLRPVASYLNGEPDGFEELVVRTESIDDLVARGAAPPPDFLKLDTEGSELDVLHGAGEQIDRGVVGVLTEVLVAAGPSEGVALHEIMGFLAERGFVLFDIKLSRMNRTGTLFGGKKGAIDSLYLLYLRDFADLHQGHLAGRPDEARHRLLATLVAAAGYLYLDYCVELIAYGREHGLLRDDEAAAALRVCTSVRDVSWAVPRFPGKAGAALGADLLSYVLQPQAKHALPPLHNNLGNRRVALVRQRPPSRIRVMRPVLARTDRHRLTWDIDGVDADR